jgi:hypothetical protein
LADAEIAAASPDAAVVDSEAALCLLTAATKPPGPPGQKDMGGKFVESLDQGRLLGKIVFDNDIGPHVQLDGFIFRTLHRHDPDGRDLVNEAENFVELPSDFEVCPHDEPSIRACREHPWQVLYLVFSDGTPRYTSIAGEPQHGQCTPGNTGGSPPNLARQGNAIAARTNGNSWNFDVFIRQRQ